MNLPSVRNAEIGSAKNVTSLFVGAYGFEDRSLGWTKLAGRRNGSIGSALIVRYMHRKGINRIKELQDGLRLLGCSEIREVKYNVRNPMEVEDTVEDRLLEYFSHVDEIIIDISAMTKFLVMIVLCKLRSFEGRVRIVYTEAEEYAPTEREYLDSKDAMELIAKFPSRGANSILRARCLSSIRMQGQPVTMVAFTSFNEQLVRHMLGTITPHRLIFINGRPPRESFRWRERATQEIHAKLIDQYKSDNLIDGNGRLVRTASTLDCLESMRLLEEIYKQAGLHERIIVAATGSKMQTVGLFLHKMTHSDVHVEYPTPDSYYVTGMSKGVYQVYDVTFESFASSMRGLARVRSTTDSI
jgi:hypothetical protein